MDRKPTNPKDAIAVAKLPTHLVPSTIIAYAAMAFAEGASKYGAYNWRVTGVRASVYLSALDRHMMKYKNGEEYDQETKVPHLASAIACIGIIIDASLCGKLVDDRPPSVPMGEMIVAAEAIVAGLFMMHSDKNPRHMTIEDTTDAKKTDL